jgi:hypothetical protein
MWIFSRICTPYTACAVIVLLLQLTGDGALAALCTDFPERKWRMTPPLTVFVFLCVSFSTYLDHHLLFFLCLSPYVCNTTTRMLMSVCFCCPPLPATHRYTFDDEDASDSVGTLDGTITGATFVDGPFGRAMSFDGNDYVTLPSALGATGNAARSIVFWAKFGTQGAAYAVWTGAQLTRMSLYRYLYPTVSISHPLSIFMFVTPTRKKHNTRTHMSTDQSFSVKIGSSTTYFIGYSADQDLAAGLANNRW